MIQYTSDETLSIYTVQYITRVGVRDCHCVAYDKAAENSYSICTGSYCCLHLMFQLYPSQQQAFLVTVCTLGAAVQCTLLK